jgi:hypothetical protein
MEGKLVRWAVMSREVGQRAVENPIINYDVSKRLVVLEAKVIFTNKAGGMLVDAWLEDSEKRRYIHPNALYADYWRQMYRCSYSEVDRYFVEPLLGTSMRKSLLLAGGYTSTSQNALSLRAGQELCAGLGFYVPEGTRNLILNISSKVDVEKTIIGGMGGVRVDKTEETIQLKVGDIPAGL